MANEKLKKHLTESVRGYYRKRYPYKSKGEEDKEHRTYAEKVYKKWYNKVYALSFFMMIAGTVPCVFLMHQSCALILRILYPETLILDSDWDEYIIPAIFMSIILNVLVAEKFQKWLTGAVYEVLDDYHAYLRGYDTNKVLYHMCKVIALLLIIITVGIARSYVVIDNNTFIISRFNYIKPHKYYFSEVQQIYYRPDYMYIRKGGWTDNYTIYFFNGDSLTTQDIGYDNSKMGILVDSLLLSGVRSDTILTKRG